MITTREDDFEVQVKHGSDVQAQARKMLRRLMADRNMRTTQFASLIGEESHTVRRMLNGSRAITLDDVVKLAVLGAYSLDEAFLQREQTSSQVRSAPQSVDSNLSRVFSAIAELLSPATDAGTPATRYLGINVPRGESASRAQNAEPAAQRSFEPGGLQKRGRGRPRKYPLND
jgi:plasmid maintenance system antidote protein VapI